MREFRTLVPLRAVLSDDEFGADFDDVPRLAALGQTLLGVGPGGVERVARLDPDVAVPVRDVGRQLDGRSRDRRPGVRQQDGHLAQEDVATGRREQLVAPAANPPVQGYDKCFRVRRKGNDL